MSWHLKSVHGSEQGRFRFSAHALGKVKSRGVSLVDVYAVLRDPDDVFRDMEHDALIAIKGVGDKHVIVAHAREDEVIKGDYCILRQ